jgi:hypothetical protein
MLPRGRIRRVPITMIRTRYPSGCLTPRVNNEALGHRSVGSNGDLKRGAAIEQIAAIEVFDGKTFRV